MKRKFYAALLAATMLVTAIPGQSFANQTDESTSELSDDGYNLVWSDEFNDSALNRNDWNVETHEKGWVNNELQEYVDSEENIFLQDGKLVIKPVEKVDTVTAGNMLANPDFAQGMEGWTETIANWGGEYVTDATSTVQNGAIIYSIKNPGTEDWHVQLKQGNISLKNGHTYTVSFNIKSTEARKFKTGVMDASYVWFGGTDCEIGSEGKKVEFEFTMTQDATADFYISLGKFEEDSDTPASEVTISDISMIDEAGDAAITQKSYTSGRISTQNKHAFTYGRFECRAKVPKGQGFLPAFWLMANDENIYGQWPRCGEIDCMEVMGQEPDKVYGTIHYGNPHSESQGTAETADGESDFSDDFHTFTCDWEPGVIKWYVDGKLYHEESDWYSTTEGQGTLTYPAPFDQPFYIILNLAVGGSWVGNPDDSTSFDDNTYQIDYVRVYQKDSYDENVSRPIKDVTLRNPDASGNYINNGDFSEKENLKDGKNWEFMTAQGGDATAEIDNNIMTVKTAKEGSVDYSVQLVQADIPLQKGAAYQVQFDACASEARTMGVDIKAPDHGYNSYMPHKEVELTTKKQTYTYEFEMKDASDANGRLEYNMGAKGSTADIYISNVSIKKIKDPDPNAKEVKTVLANGNYVYNGSFQEGEGHLGYWNITNPDGADVTVTPFSDGRRLKVSMKNGAKSPVTVSQEDLAFTAGTPYRFSFSISSDSDNTVIACVGGKTYEAAVKAGETKTVFFDIPSDVSFENKNISVTLGTSGTTWIDNVSLAENALIKNGSFKDGITGYTVYIDSSASGSYVVDSLKDTDALAVTIKNTGDQDWKVQVKQDGVRLEKGKKYKLSFKAKSSIDRQIRVIMQGKENRGYAVYSDDNVVDLTDEYQTFEDIFVMNEDTDEAAFFSACLGKIGDRQITTQHEVRIDDITLEEVKDEEPPKGEPKDESKDESKDEPKETLSIIDNNGVLPEGTKLESQKIGKETKLYAEVQDVLTKNGITGKFVAYELNLEDVGGNIISGQLSGAITVIMPIPEGLSVSADKTIAVYRINDDGTLVKCKTTVKDGNVSFETDHFSKYVFVEENIEKSVPQEPQTPPEPQEPSGPASQEPSGSAPQAPQSPAAQVPAQAAPMDAGQANASNTPETPKTGDNSPIWSYVLLMASGIAALGVIFKKRSAENNANK